MRAAAIQRQGDPVAPNVAVMDDWPDPVAGPGELVVRTEASAMNQLDLYVGRGVPGLELEYPRISGSDGCGIVESAGEGVDPAWAGRRVLLNAAVFQDRPPRPGVAPAPAEIRMIGEHLPGSMAERFKVPATNVLDVGATDPVEAAAFGLTHLTAWRMLVARAGLRPGMTVLATGIGGGVALAVLNICRHFGCTVIVTSRHRSKLERARELGAHHGVLDTGEDFSREVRGLTGKRGVDICADSVGAAIHMPCMKSLARGGVYVTCGATSGAETITHLGRIFWNQCSIVGSTMGDMDEYREVTALLTAGLIRPVVDSVHDAADAPAAYARLESAEQFGKVVVRWG